MTLPAAESEQHRTLTLLWWAILAGGVVRLIATLVDLGVRRSQVAFDLLGELRRSQPGATLAGAQLVVAVGMVFVLVTGGVLVAAGLLVVDRLGRATWAPTVLTVAGLWLVVSGVGTLFESGKTAGPAGLIAGMATIVQGVLAAGALYVAHSGPSANR